MLQLDETPLRSLRRRIRSTYRPSAFAAVAAFIFFAGVGSVGRSMAAPPSSTPNVLLILADDLGFSDLGCYGGEIKTPNLDSIAEQGLRFTQFYNTARCWPTRGSLLTGYYAQQIRRDHLPGVPTGGGNRGQRPAWATLLPALLDPAGYRSYHIGKWHLDGMPTESGFDRSYYLQDLGRYFNPARHLRDGRRLPAINDGDSFYLTSAMADYAVEDLKDHAANHAGEPFFQYLAFTAPHFPLQALPEDIALYDPIYTVGWDVIRKQRWKRMQQMGLLDDDAVSSPSAPERQLGPPYHFPEAFEILGDGEINKPVPWESLTAEQKQFQAKKMAVHAAMVHRMDVAIGRVFQQIRAMDQWDNTLIMFLSDNGASAEIMVRGDGHDPEAPAGSAASYLCLGPGWSTTCNTPFRRHKTWTHEGGISTPMILSWPAGMTARGEFRRQPQHVIDIAATLLELTGTKHPADAPEPPGQSFLDQFASEVPSEPRTLWWYHDEHRAIRQGDWKAVAPEGEPWELYDLSTDRTESVDLALPRGDRLDQMVATWQQMLDDMIELASRDLPKSVLGAAEDQNARSGRMWEAQQAAKPKRTQVLINAETFRIKGRHAFLMRPNEPADGATGKPWIFYAPTLSPYPDRNESWMHQQFLDAGVAVAGIDVGEAYGSPHSQRYFDALYDDMVSKGYSRKPALLGRSRGGLYVARFAIERPNRVAAIGGIYPVFDYTDYPGVQRAAAVYGVSADELQFHQERWNPIKQSEVLAEAQIPVYIIHGTDDRLVPIASNSAALGEVYGERGQQELFQLEQAAGQGHSAWPGFFRCQPLIDFLIEAARKG
ncbi:sulfatase-like hydrolase/transferase [Roseiconus nitratireducens]|uniref:Sulfatase-like hydrolase/transferase n=2 Tax=Roseiconus nitratireducens TaxID=2605748 RepID=A0A5M6DJ84_9BACT|nr:sulfatase-like hydrolase/transferase [Roseiconus nitratireducens]